MRHALLGHFLFGFPVSRLALPSCGLRSVCPTSAYQRHLHLHVIHQHYHLLLIHNEHAVGSTGSSRPFGKVKVTFFEIFLTDVDECATDSHQCNPTQICINTEGGYTCSCTDGYWLLEGQCLGNSSLGSTGTVESQ